MSKLNKELLVEMVNEFLSAPQGGIAFGRVIGDQPVADVRNYDQAERIVGLIHDLTQTIRGGIKSGAISSSDARNVRDFPMKRIQRALDYVSSTIDAEIGDDNLDMTTPEI